MGLTSDFIDPDIAWSVDGAINCNSSFNVGQPNHNNSYSIHPLDCLLGKYCGADKEVVVPVTIKSLNGQSALLKFGVDPAYVGCFSQPGNTVHLTATKFDFNVGGHTANVAVSLAALQKLSIGSLPADVKEAYKKKLEATIVGLLNDSGKLAGALDLLPKEMVVGVEKVIVDSVPDPPAPPSPKPPDKVEKWEPVKPADMVGAPPVKLRNAKRLYQAVRGTSSGSRYFLIAANDDLRIAARWVGPKLSIRIEGPGIMKHVERIAAAGLGAVSDKEYASMHLHVDDDMLAAKAVGAVLMGLGVKLETPLPNLAIIKNMGS